MLTDKFLIMPWKQVAVPFLILLLIFSVTACKQNGNTQELYHKFQDGNWARFNMLNFEILLKSPEKPYDVYLFARFTPSFAYEKLGFNMVMNTPDGEERINAYELGVRTKTGEMAGKCSHDSCEQTLLLKRELHINKAGVLKIQIENLTPRLVTEGVLGVGIRVVPSGK